MNPVLPLGCKVDSPFSEIQEEQSTNKVIDEYLKNNVDSFISSLSSFLHSSKDPINFLQELIYSIRSDSRLTIDDKVTLLSRLLHFPEFTQVMERLLKEHPEEFAMFSDFLELEADKKRLFFRIFDSVLEKGEDPKAIIIEASIKIVNGQKGIRLRSMLLTSLLETFESEDLELIYAKLLKENEPKMFTLIYSLLSEELSLNAAVKQFCLLRNLDDFPNLIHLLIETAVNSSKQAFHSKSSFLIVALLEELDSENLLKSIIFNRIEEFTIESQCMILWSMENDLQQKLIKLYANKSQLLEKWVANLKNYFSLDDYIELIKVLISALDHDDLKALLIQCIEANNPAIPYLWFAISQDQLEALISDSSATLNDLLGKSLRISYEDIDDLRDRYQKKSNLSRFLCIEIPLIIENDLLDPMPFKDLYFHIVSFLNNEERESITTSYQPLFEKLPLLIIMLTMQNANYRNEIISAIPYFNENQLKLIIHCFSPDEAVKEISQIVNTLPLDRIETILRFFNTEQMIAFLLYYKNRVSSIVSSFQDRHYNLSERLNDYVKNGCIKEEAETISLQAYQLLGNLNETQTPFYKLLIKFDFSGKLEEDIDQSKSYLETLRKDTVFDKLNQICKPYENSDQLTISNDYWTRIKNKDLVQLKILNAGKILDIGIQCDEDFAAIGLSREYLSEIKQILNAIHIIQEYDTITMDKICKLEDNLLVIDLSVHSQEFNNLLDELIIAYDLSNMPPDLLVDKLKTIIQSLNKENLKPTLNEKIWIQSFFTLIEKREEIENLSAICIQMFKWCLIYLKKRTFHYKLKKYLSQPFLNERWELLHQLQLFSLSQIKES